jgi:hypothetical protein
MSVLVARRVLQVAIAGAVVLNLLRAMPRSVHVYVAPFWRLTYGHGFVRRGLVGTLFQWMVHARSTEEQESAAVAIQATAVAALAVAVSIEAVRLARSGQTATRFAVLTGVVALLLSRLVPTLGRNEGALDVYLILLTFVSARAFDRGRVLLAIALASIGPFIHEAFLFQWCAVVVLALRPDGTSIWTRLRKRGIVLLPIVLAIVVMRLHSPAALAAELAPMPFDQAVKDGIIGVVFGMSVRNAVVLMLGLHRDYWGHVLACLPVFLTPVPLIVAMAVRLDPDPSRKRAIGVALLATIAPYPILLVAWDLSRFLVWIVLAAVLVLFANAHAANERAVVVPPPTRNVRAVAVGWLVILIFLTTGPHLGVWFDVAFGDVGLSADLFGRSPASTLTYRFLLFYDAKNLVYRWSMTERCDVARQAATRLGDECAFRLEPGGTLNQQGLMLSPGEYVFSAVTRPEAACSRAKVKLSAYSDWQFGRELGSMSFNGPSSASLSFAIGLEDAAMGRQRLVVEAEHDCVIIEELVLVKGNAR